MLPDDPRHGSRRGYIAGCRDDCCRNPHLRYQKRSTLRRHREGTQVVDATAVLKRVNWWAEHGITRNALHQAARLGEGTLAELCLGERTVIYKANARKLMAVTWNDLPDNSLCNASLTIARIRSLMAAGHTLTWIAENSSRFSTGGGWRYQASVSLRLARDIQALYQAAPLSGPSKITATKARNTGALHPLAWDDPGVPAERHGWTPPAPTNAYDHGVDHATVLRVLAGETLRTNNAERHEIMRRWLAAGNSERSLCERLGWHDGRYGKVAA